MVYSLKFVRSLAPRYANSRLEGIDGFLEKYSEIVKRDKKTPVFSLTAKYKSFPKKHYKKSLNNVVSVKNFRLFKSTTKRDEIKRLILKTLNKVNDDNVEKIVDELEMSITKLRDASCLDILAQEIYKKIVFDSTYHENYIRICEAVWGLREWHFGLISIVKSEEGLYWGKNTDDSNDTELYGPFDTEQAIREDSFKKMNFKVKMINLLQSVFMDRSKFVETLSAPDLDEETAYKTKTEFMSVIGFLVKLREKNHIREQILHIVLNSFLKEQPRDLFVEAYIHFWKTLSSQADFRTKFQSHYDNLFTQTLNNHQWKNRIKFLMEAHLGTRQEREQRDGSGKERERSEGSGNEPERDFDTLERIVRKSVKDLGDLRSDNERQDVLEIVIDRFFDYPDNLFSETISVIEKYGMGEMAKAHLISMDLEDLEIDIPNIREIYKKLLDVLG